MIAAFITSFLPLLFFQVCHGQVTQVPRFCGGHPADIVFIMDSSGSISGMDFDRQKAFVSGMVNLFDIDSGKIRVGIVSYSNWAFLEFNLNTFGNKSDIIAAVNKVTHFKGDTNTGSAIEYMRDLMFQEHNGARRDVPHIAIILSDGRSNDPLYAMTEAKTARRMGITMFAIGVGDDVARYELTSIASDPDSEYVFQVGDYVALQYIKELLAIRACEVPGPNQKRKFTTTTPEPVTQALACKDTAVADIVFATSPASSPDNADKTLAFFKEIVAGLDIKDDNIRIGLVPKNCDTLPDINVDGSESRDDLLAKLDRVIAEQGSIDSVIRYMRKNSFSTDSGSREHSKKIGVVIVEEGDNLYKSKIEALKAREAGIEIFVIGVGSDIKFYRLKSIASHPASEHVFRVKSYDELPPILRKVENAICPPVSS